SARTPSGRRLARRLPPRWDGRGGGPRWRTPCPGTPARSGQTGRRQPCVGRSPPALMGGQTQKTAGSFNLFLLGGFAPADPPTRSLAGARSPAPFARAPRPARRSLVARSQQAAACGLCPRPVLRSCVLFI